MDSRHLLVLTATLLGAATAPGLARASAQIAAKAGCVACHAADKKMVGPSWRDIAARYKGQPDAAVKLAAVVRKGGQGTWGAVPMAPVPATSLGDADLKAVVAWVLKSH